MQRLSKRKRRAIARRQQRRDNMASGAHAICKGHKSSKRTPKTTMTPKITSDYRESSIHLDGIETEIRIYTGCDMPKKKAFAQTKYGTRPKKFRFAA